MPNTTSADNTSVGGYFIALAAASGAAYGLHQMNRRVSSYAVRSTVFGVLGATSLIGVVAAKTAGWRLFFLSLAAISAVGGVSTYMEYRGWSKGHARQSKGSGTKSEKQLKAAEEKPALFEEASTAAGNKLNHRKAPKRSGRGMSKQALAASARGW